MRTTNYSILGTKKSQFRETSRGHRNVIDLFSICKSMREFKCLPPATDLLIFLLVFFCPSFYVLLRLPSYWVRPTTKYWNIPAY